MIRTEHTLWLLGLLLAGFALRSVANRSRYRASTIAFWAVMAFTFLAGDAVPPAIVGAAVLVLGLLVAIGGVAPASARTNDADADSRERHGNRLFIPVLLIPALTVTGVLLLPRLQVSGQPLVPASSATLVSLAVACAIALGVALWITRARASVALGEGQRLLDAIGWAAVLPLLLATLGAVFDRAGVGTSVARIVTGVVPVDIRPIAVLAYAGGMTLFTMIMGNAFAAFPVMTAGIGLPILVGLHHADPAPMCALGMLSGYCGTLMTPMAANFNLVPAALLELKDPNGVIKAQAPTGALVWLVNLVLMNFLLF